MERGPGRRAMPTKEVAPEATEIDANISKTRLDKWGDGFLRRYWPSQSLVQVGYKPREFARPERTGCHLYLRPSSADTVGQ